MEAEIRVLRDQNKRMYPYLSLQSILISTKLVWLMLYTDAIGKIQTIQLIKVMFCVHYYGLILLFRMVVLDKGSIQK